MNVTVKRMVAMSAVLAVLLTAEAADAQSPVQPSPVGRVVDTLNPLNWRMPQWQMPKFSGILPAKEETMRIKKKKDGLFDEVTQTASRSWQRTKEALSPKNLNPVRFFPASARTPTPKPENDQPGFFGSLFSPRPEPQNAQTVTDFLGQPKPKG